MADVIDIDKTRPIRVLDSRRDALVKWLADGQKAIKEAEQSIIKHKQEAIEMVAEIDEIDAALNDLYAAQKKNQEA
jgi:septal ring factor EnvC (AmiA/AmiB activator)